MKHHLLTRILSVLLVAAMLAGFVPTPRASAVTWTESDLQPNLRNQNLLVQASDTAAGDKMPATVRVSIVLEEKSTLQAGFSTTNISQNTAAMAYNAAMRKKQEAVQLAISRQALGGEKLDVVWNMTLVGNLISANVPSDKIDEIAQVEGVAQVVIEQQYALQLPQSSAQPTMSTAGGMIGSSTVWSNGYTGAGSRIAIIDTGTDTDHQSFDNGAFLHALEQNAAKAGMDFRSYVSSLNLLDADEISQVVDVLNISQRISADAWNLYRNEKLPFGANYVDYSLDITHDNDYQGSHGSHVAGIAAANRYIPSGSGYTDALQSTGVAGVAPDAQIITLKVFGNAAGPYDSDYFAAVEDAIYLGCDAVNLSLGSSNPGMSYNDYFVDLLDYLQTTDTVVSISAGNSGRWAEASYSSYLYHDDVNFDTVGSPGSYASALTVASVDNAGSAGYCFCVGDLYVFYTETYGPTNWPMSWLDTSSGGTGTDYEYVFISGYGYESDYAGIDLTDKVVFCSRGDTAFYEKANTAASLGAAAVVIYNYENSPIGMDLTDYVYSAPCVSILNWEANSILDASVRNTSTAGTTYYTGTMTIYGSPMTSIHTQDSYTMSFFSSWGVPGDLSMKPEISAPGGEILSVNGVDPSGTAYEFMSGTSMAAPQVAGMAALVAQYLKETGMEVDGVTRRGLAQSLLMSTAQPMLQAESGYYYYSILNQGAGLARVDLATTTDTVILVDDQPDGKVKAELGDDPGRTGKYSFSFTIHNLGDSTATYALTADLFTQDVFDGGDGTLHLDTWTTPLDAGATYTANGAPIQRFQMDFACDLDGNGVTDARDADYLLEYLVGNKSSLNAHADLNGDGLVNTYDAHLLLAQSQGVPLVDVSAGGSVTIGVTLELTASAKAELDESHPDGAYVEGYVFVQPTAGDSVTHSIPVLGFYGSWTDPSMYDVGTALEYIYGVESRTPYLYAYNGLQGNMLTYLSGGTEYIFGGNPIVEESTYLPQRNALNYETSTLRAIYAALIRNAAAMRVEIANADTGELYFAREMGEAYSAYYFTNGGYWENTRQQNTLNWAGTDASGQPLANGTRVRVTLMAAPEYYRVSDPYYGYTADWDALGDGAKMTTEFTIDLTSPTLLDAKQSTSNPDILTVTAQDNQYIAAVALLNASGTSILAAASPNQTTAGAKMTTQLDISAVFGENFLVAVYDYAGNVATYAITLALDNQRPRFTAIDRTNSQYVGITDGGTEIPLASTTGRIPALAAEYVDGWIFEINEDSELYVGSDDDLSSFTFLRELDPEDEWQIGGFNDLAYNAADGKLYGNFYSYLNNMATPFLCTIDLNSGEMTVLGAMPIDANNMAIDGEGNFYSTIYGSSQLYTYTCDVVSTGRTTYIGSLGYYSTTYNNSLAWDHNTDGLYWACSGNDYTDFVKVDPATGSVTYLFGLSHNTVGLYIVSDASDGALGSADTVRSLEILGADRTIKGGTVQLSAQLSPWNVSDNRVTWSSSNPAVATVDAGGLVTGVSSGTTTITATSVLNPSVSARMEFTVFTLSTTLNAVVWDEMGDVWVSEFNTGSLPGYTKLTSEAASAPLTAVTYGPDGRLYASSIDMSSSASTVYTMDPDSLELTTVGPSSICYTDLVYTPNLSGFMLGLYFNYMVLVDPTSGEYLGAWDWSGYTAGNLVGITYLGSEYDYDYGAYADYVLILDDQGNVYLDAFLYTAGYGAFYLYGPEYGLLGSLGDPVDTPYFQDLHYDGTYVYWSRFHQADNQVQLLAWDLDNTGNVYDLGNFPEGVWPVSGLFRLGENPMTTSAVSKLPRPAGTNQSKPAPAQPQGEMTQLPIRSASVNQSTARLDRAKDTVELELVLPENSTNGLIRVTFDAGLTVQSVSSSQSVFAWSQSGNSLTIAYAAANELAKNSTLATVSFRYADETTYGITVVHEELGSAQPFTTERLSVNTGEPIENPFTDVSESDYFYDPVLWAVENGITSGATDTTFEPHGISERCQVVTFLWRAAGCPEPTSTNNPFTDVNQSHYFYKAVLWAVEKGITQGTSATTFSPYDKCERCQVVTFLWRAAGKPAPTSTNNPFNDVKTSAYYYDAVLWAVEKGITSGTAAGTFSPVEKCERCQIVTFLYRYYVN